MATKGQSPPQVTLDDLKEQLNRIECELTRRRTRDRQNLWLFPLGIGAAFILAGGATWWASLWTLTAIGLGLVLMSYSWWKIAQLRKLGKHSNDSAKLK